MSGIGDALGGMMTNFGNTLAGTNQAPAVNTKTGASNTINNLGSNIGKLIKAGGGSAGASGELIRTNPYGDMDLKVPYADADLQEPSGDAHWTLREEDNFILAKNQRTGELQAVETRPLTTEERKQALAPHGAGSLEANDPNRKARVANDEDLVPVQKPVAPAAPAPVQPQGAVDARGMPIQEAPAPLPSNATPQTSPVDAVQATFKKIDEAQAQHANLKNAEMIAYQQAMRDAKASLLKTAGTSHAPREPIWQAHAGNAGVYVVDPSGRTYYVPNGGKAALDVLTGPSGRPSQGLQASPQLAGGGKTTYDFPDMDLKGPEEIARRLQQDRASGLGARIQSVLEKKYRGK